MHGSGITRKWPHRNPANFRHRRHRHRRRRHLRLHPQFVTLWLPTEIFQFDINPNANGPTRFLDGSIDLPIAHDLKR
ncbi:hypothetical protein QN391_02480 [Pseudomonas sp. CCI1.2]|nr:hypothetical protein [Pseudomonas sp. CCI1.2]MEB0119571.1 hypothetical protein [Pseudomonas sp. CCI1.2]